MVSIEHQDLKFFKGVKRIHEYSLIETDQELFCHTFKWEPNFCHFLQFVDLIQAYRQLRDLGLQRNVHYAKNLISKFHPTASVDSEFFFFFFTYRSAIVEASTSDLENAPTFLLILLVSLARPFSLCIFSDSRFCILSFSALFLFVVSAFSSYPAFFPLHSLVLKMSQLAFCHTLFFKLY